MTDVFLNGKFVGDVDDGHEFTKNVVDERRNNRISSNLNLYFDEGLDAIFIETGKGRNRRPLIVVKNGKSMLNDKHVDQIEKGELVWDDLVKQGIIEYLDAVEEESALVAFTEEELTPSNTHLEINPLVMLGITTALVPYGNYSQATRVATGGKNQKQAVGYYAANFPNRVDMDVNLLQYPQLPIVTTAIHSVSKYDKHPSGQNVVVAIMSYEGYNIEDSIMINKASIERGFGRSTYFRPMVADELRYSGGLVDEISIPDKEVKGYRSEHDYRFLEEDGMVYPGAFVKEGDVVIGRTSPPRFLSGLDEYNLAQNSKRESSLSLEHGEEGIVDQVFLTESEEGNKLVQVRLRSPRIPEIGDKFTSRHGQKGVVGLIVPTADMPFTASGITPDIIFNPNGIPSRMTVSHLLELIGAKVGALAGRYIDGTTFNVEPEVELRSQLLSLGFREDGTETMYNGFTGEAMKVRIYVGSMYYLRLKHMVANKMHSRARGPVQLLTRQPTEGRAKEGGLRLGEMEKDTFVAHGAAMVLKERFDSDKTLIPVCTACGSIAINNVYKDMLHCPSCGDNTEIDYIEISYAFKLLLDELRSLCLFPKLNLESKY
ncbi:DNA-directed RNA polymerase subunit B [Candidatus Woesearchaeota archaeon]|nr:DNA-directed RNA polymerase subunit B [Candidatus Woesearchaeota archaeon]